MRLFGPNLNPYKYKHPDLLVYDLRNGKGEFGIDFDLKFQRWLDYLTAKTQTGLYEPKKIWTDYKEDLAKIKRKARKRIGS